MFGVFAGVIRVFPLIPPFFSELRKRVVNANMSPIRHYMQSTASFPALVVLLLLLLSQTGGSSAAFLCEFPSKALLKQVQTTFSHSDRWSAKAGGVS